MILPGLLALVGALATLQAAPDSSPDASPAPPPEPRTPWVVGEPLPHVHLPDVTTNACVDLARYRGKKLLLIEFASW